MSAITVTQSVPYQGTSLAYQSIWAPTGDTLANDGRTKLIFKSSSGSSFTATLDTPAKIEGLDIANPTVTVDNTADKTMGPFDPAIFNTAGGVINISYTGATNFGTVAAVSG